MSDLLSLLESARSGGKRPTAGASVAKRPPIPIRPPSHEESSETNAKKRQAMREARVQSSVSDWLFNTALARDKDWGRARSFATGPGAKVYAKAVLEGDVNPWAVAEAYQKDRKFRFAIDTGNSVRNARSIAAGVPVNQPVRRASQASTSPKGGAQKRGVQEVVVVAGQRFRTTLSSPTEAARRNARIRILKEKFPEQYREYEAAQEDAKVAAALKSRPRMDQAYLRMERALSTAPRPKAPETQQEKERRIERQLVDRMVERSGWTRDQAKSFIKQHGVDANHKFEEALQREIDSSSPRFDGSMLWATDYGRTYEPGDPGRRLMGVHRTGDRAAQMVNGVYSQVGALLDMGLSTPSLNFKTNKKLSPTEVRQLQVQFRKELGKEGLKVIGKFFGPVGKTADVMDSIPDWATILTSDDNEKQMKAVTSLGGGALENWKDDKKGALLEKGLDTLLSPLGEAGRFGPELSTGDVVKGVKMGISSAESFLKKEEARRAEAKRAEAKRVEARKAEAKRAAAKSAQVKRRS